jgi:outer membrane protein TolC
MNKERTRSFCGVAGLGLLLWTVFCNFGFGQASTGMASRRSLHLIESIQNTLANHPLLRMQQLQVTINRGAAAVASGKFDTTFNNGFDFNTTSAPLTPFQQQQDLPYTSTFAETKVSSYTLALNKVFRTGISASSTLDLNRTTDNLFQQPGVNTSNFGLTITVPLLQGRGRGAVAAQESAANAEVEASMLDLSQLVSQLIANTATSYWNFVAARQTLRVTGDAEDRGEEYLDNVQAFIEADLVPRNDLNEAQANLSHRMADRVAAEQQAVASQQQLALDMGKPAAEMLDSFRPEDDFPISDNRNIPSDSASDFKYYIEQALANRADFAAASRRVREKRMLAAEAHNRLLPQLNLTFGANYQGLVEGHQINDFFSSSVLGVPGPSSTIGINYVFPPGNHAARGAFIQASGVEQQSELQVSDLARQVSSQVVVAVEAVRNSAFRVKSAERSVVAFRSALDGQREKYKNGLGNITDVLTVEDRLTTALIDEVQAQLSFALAIVQFRFATGTIVSYSQPTLNLQPDVFSAPPFLAGPKIRERDPQ